jgi:hypothetical protein
MTDGIFSGRGNGRDQLGQRLKAALPIAALYF